MKCIREEEFEREMQETVLPYLEEHKKSGYCRTENGGELYYEAYLLQKRRGSVVISHGFSESIQKYKEMVYYFLKEGYQVFLADHRGHGYSMRETGTKCLIYVNQFDDYVKDIHSFVTQIVKPEEPGSCYLLGHSMGGAIAAAYLEAYPGDFERAVLTAPMLRIKTGPLPELTAFLIASVMCAVGKGGCPVIGQAQNLDGECFEKSPALSEARFLWYLKQRRGDVRLQTTASSYRWVAASILATHRITSVRACKKVKIPVLMFLAGRDTLVKPGGIRKFAGRISDIRLCRFRRGKHELYEMRTKELERYYNRIFAFLKEDK